MKTYPLILSLLLTAMLAVSLQAQSERNFEQRQEARKAAWTAAAAGDLSRARDEIKNSLRREPGTAGWHVENALALFHLGRREREAGRSDNAIRLGNEALRQLVQAERRATDSPEMRADIKNLAATVLEQLSGDSVLADAVRAEGRKDRKRGDGSSIDRVIEIPESEL